MKILNNVFGVYFMILILIFSGCSRKKIAPTYITEQLKSYAVFQVGSYWIFKNEITGVFDSTYILTAPHFFFLGNSDEAPNAQGCSIRYGGTIISGSILNPYEDDLTFPNGLKSPCLIFSNVPPGVVENFKNIAIFDSLKVNNKFYYDVINTSNLIAFENGDTIVYTFYLAKLIGLIKISKKENKHDTTWSLINQHVIQ
jgi:hypothetical protein